MESKTHSKPRHPKLLAASSAAAILVLGLGAFALVPQQTSTTSSAAPQQQSAHLEQVASRSVQPHMLEAAAPFSFADLVERVSPAVVTVTVEQEINAAAGMNMQDIPEPFRDFFNQQGQDGKQFNIPRKAVAMGSGFIVDKSGFIVTNNHVVENAKTIKVKLTDGREFIAKLVGTDPATDVAVLKIKSDRSLPSVDFGDDRQVRVGDWVIAVGNPFGLSNTVTAGIVSSIGRDVGNGPYTNFIQIDAPINRGNSGGPTFDTRGRVIGMNSMIFSPSGGSVGIGFAIPASTVRDIVAQLEAHGRVARGWLGVEVQAITPEMAASFGSKDLKGAIVANVVPGGPAQKAGFHQGDLVVAINGSQVDDSRDLTRRVAALQAGSTATFTVVREGTKQDLHAKVGSRKEQQVASNDSPDQPAGAPATTAEAMGLGLASVTPDVRRAFNLNKDVDGVVITKVDPNSDAADKGIQPGDVVVSVANRAVHSPQEMKSRIADAKAQGRSAVLMLVSGQNGQRFVAVKIDRT
ncbi:MAG TPA: DegQ family serine endoprotease [Rhizomicrobium sp.]|jgi:serine protease Do|nr:DegQ family serine endoprotease [Rhizomicrobium sp.]